MRGLCEKVHNEEIAARRQPYTEELEPMSDPFKDLQNSIARNLALISEPTDHALLKQAEISKGHISLSAVSEEYNRLILQKIEQNASRGFWARLFGG
jgi:hypothetical protein